MNDNKLDLNFDGWNLWTTLRCNSKYTVYPSGRPLIALLSPPMNISISLTVAFVKSIPEKANVI